MMYWFRTSNPALLLSVWLSLGLGIGLSALEAQTAIQEARNLPVGTSVTISGRVINGSELGTIRYIEDGTGGLPAYPGSGSVPGFAAQVQRGDSVSVTGVLYDYNGLLELSPVTAFTVHSTGLPLPDPPGLSLSEIGEGTEGTLARFGGLTFLETGDFKGSTLYTVQDDQGNQADVYIRNGQDLVGTPIPSAPVDLVAIISAYFGYQLLPRDLDDLIPTTDLFFNREVDQVDLDQNSVTFTWETNLPSGGRIRVQDPLGQVWEDTLGAMSSLHTYTVDGLSPATIYRIRVIAERQSESIQGQQVLMSTASVLPGSMEVYFNQSVDPSFSMGAMPLATSGDEVLDLWIDLIQSATSTIDVAMYNIDEPVVVNALNIAANKGVQVRYVAAEATANMALSPPPAFPIIYGNTWALMHNKILIVDAQVPGNAAVLTGSMNLTGSQIYSYPNNLVLLRDHALARAYTLEFEEMWGSQGADPDPVYARFGSMKQDNTPHLFKINGSLVESRFSPSDFTNREIREELQAATTSIRFALLTFTKDDLAQALVEQAGKGLEVRGIIDNINDNGSEYDYLLAQGVNVVDHVFSAILHHKYALIDDATVITGSHNWSNAADQSNDENTLIIHDAKVADCFRQEFEERWGELVVPVQDPGSSVPEWQVGMDGGILLVSGQVLRAGLVRVVLRDLSGHEVLWTDWNSPGGHELKLFPLPSLPAGFYAMEIRSPDGIICLPVMGL